MLSVFFSPQSPSTIYNIATYTHAKYYSSDISRCASILTLHADNYMGNKNKQKLTAETADRHTLYQLSVQCVESEIDMVDQTYKDLYGRHATRLREDFCGTSNTSCEWVRRRKDNTAIGLDWDAAVLGWGLDNNVSKLDKAQQARIRLLQQDVLKPPQLANATNNSHGTEIADTVADIVLAMNFSYMAFKTREQLRTYFAAAHAGLADDGMLMIDCYGGHDSWRNIKEKTKCEGFSYFWQQRKFNPITGDIKCHIHFKFPDGTRMKRAFSYDWRMWTLPEIRELLSEAGFSKSIVYWEGTDPKTGEGNDIYVPTEKGEDDPSWIVYVAAQK